MEGKLFKSLDIKWLIVFYDMMRFYNNFHEDRKGERDQVFQKTDHQPE